METTDDGLKAKPALEFTSESQVSNIEAFLKERVYQDSLWGPAFDRDNMDEDKWTETIHDYTDGIARDGRTIDDFRTKMTKVGALALAALEWLDAQNARNA